MSIDLFENNVFSNPLSPDYLTSFVHILRPLHWIVCLALLLMVCSLPVSADWYTHRTPHFLFHYQPIDEPVAHVLIEQAGTIYEAITDDVGYAPQRTTYIYLCPTPRCFQQQHPGSNPLPAWAVGVAYPALNRIVLRSTLTADEIGYPHAAGGGAIRPVEIFRHEFAHIVLEQALAEQGGAPRWLSEGFSMYEAAQWTLYGQRTIEEVALRDAFLPLVFLTSNFPADEGMVHVAYAQSFSIVSFMFRTYGKYAFQDFIDNLRDGMDTNSALLYATGRSLKSLEQEWQEALKIRYSWWIYVIRYGGLWFGLSLLFLLAYLVKRWKMKRIQAQWDEEEAQENWEA